MDIVHACLHSVGIIGRAVNRAQPSACLRHAGWWDILERIDAFPHSGQVPLNEGRSILDLNDLPGCFGGE